jgi:hypothetical protein
MKKEDLMIGDWVNIQTERDDEPMYSQVEQLWECEIDADFQTDYENVHPIPLTPEILEKNGFTKYDVGHKVSGWSIMDDDNLYSAIPFTLTDDDFDTELGDYKWGPVEDDREESFVREVGRIKYVHELQHILKLCKIEKEIVL